MTVAYEELIDFIAAGTTPEDIVGFQPSVQTKQRVSELVRREKTSGLSEEESQELRHYLGLEHILRLAKAKARENLAKA